MKKTKIPNRWCVDLLLLESDCYLSNANAVRCMKELAFAISRGGQSLAHTLADKHKRELIFDITETDKLILISLKNSGNLIGEIKKLNP